MNGGGVGVVINFDEKSDKCNFTECRCYEDGICHGEEERINCLELAFVVLGANYADITETGRKG